MSKMEQVKALVEERLTAAVEDILGIIEHVIKEHYVEKDSRSMSEVERQNRLLDIRLQIQDPPQLSVCKEEVPPEQQERSPSLGQEDPDPPQIKEEEEETWTTQEAELEEADTKDSVFTITSVRSLHDQHQSQYPHLYQAVENREGEPLPSTSTEQMDTEADREGCGVSEPTNICNVKLNLKSSLTRHTNTHAGDIPHVCYVCGKGFSQVGDMNTHVRIHTGEKPYSCSLCEKNFKLKYSLRVHMRIHAGERPYSCSVCGRGFVIPSDLKKHMKTHTGERPYSCGVCGMGFMRSLHLEEHMKTHTGERPYSCGVCGKEFKRQQHVQNHMATHAGDRK